MSRRILTPAAQAVETFHDYTRDDDTLSRDEVLLMDAAALRSALEEVTHRRAYDAHRRGMTWQQVGDALGIARQTAAKWYALPPESLPA